MGKTTRIVMRQPQPSKLAEFVACRVCGAMLKEVKWTHLRSHGLTADQYRRDYKVDFLTSPLLRWRRAMANRRRNKDMPVWPRSRGEILRDLRVYARQRAAPLTAYWLRRRDPNLFRQAVALLGGWASALQSAGLDRVAIERWSRRRIMGRIRRRAESGQGLAYSLVAGLEPRLLGAARWHFGSWSKAVAAAGVDYQRHRARNVPPTRAEVEQALRSWVARHGPLSHAALARRSPKMIGMVRREFGTPRRAAKALGLPYQRPTPTRKWTRATVTAALADMVAAGEAVTTRSIRIEAPALYAAALRQFGALGQALEAARAAARSRGQRNQAPDALKEASADSGH